MFHGLRSPIVAAAMLGFLWAVLAAGRSAAQSDSAKSQAAQTGAEAATATCPPATGVAEPSGPDSASRPNVVAAKAGKPARVRVTISKETTVITEPLRDDGYPDYAAALNRIASEGVTPENNAAVLFWKAFGPKEIQPEAREQFFGLVGIPVLPEQGDYFIAFRDFVEAHPELVPKAGKVPRGDDRADDEPTGEPDAFERAENAYDAALERPWKARKSPLVAAWLEANAKPLELLVASSRRPKNYHPLVSDAPDPMLIAMLIPAATQYREAARALKIRAMLRLGEGEVEAAWEDLLAIHRLGRLLGNGPLLIDFLVAQVVDNIACDGDQVLLSHTRLGRDELLSKRDQLRGLQPLGRVADRIDVGERFMYCDATCAVARTGDARILGMIDTDVSDRGVFRRVGDWITRTAVDWNLPLRNGNQWYDRMVEAARRETHRQRREAFETLDLEINELRTRWSDPKRWLFGILEDPRKQVSEAIGDLMTAMMLPSLGAIVEVESRGVARRSLLETAFALAAYRADEGKYPDRLDRLVPKYVDRVPEDCFSGEVPIYRPKGKGYVLYSVGPNMKDDGGRGRDDQDGSAASADWDDIVLRMPRGKR